MKEWLEQYLRAKDAFRKEIKDLYWEHNILTVVKQDKEEHYITSDVLGLDVLKAAEAFTNATIVTNQNRSSVQELISNWNAYATSHCKLIFIKPQGGKVLLNPRVHASIADPETLEIGLQSLFQESEANA